MDPRKHQKIQSLIKSNMPKSLEKTLQFLLSISLFCFLCTFYSSWLPISSTSLQICFSSIMSNFSYNSINRQLVFLLCNGILILVTGGTGLIGSSASTTTAPHDEFHVKNGDHQQSEPNFLEMKGMKASCGDKEAKVESDGPPAHVVFKEEFDYDNENEVLEESLRPLIHANMKEEHHPSDDSIEESDEKFEDFIKKMRENMRIEALQLLPMANGYYHRRR